MGKFRRLLVASLLPWLAGCTSSAPTSPAPQSYVVSGILFETFDGISHPLARHPVTLYIRPDVTDQWRRSSKIRDRRQDAIRART